MTTRDRIHPHRRSLLFAALIATLLFGSVGDALAKKGKGKKKNKNQAASEEAAPSSAQASPGPSTARIDSRLLAYDTAGAKSALANLSDSDHANALMARGRVLEQEKNYEGAIAELERAAGKAGTDPAPKVYLGEALLHAGRQGQADSAFSAAESRARARVASNPGDSQAHYYLGVALQRLKKYPDAVSHLQKAAELAPGDALPVFQLGVTRAFQQDWAGAVEALDRAIGMNSSIAYAYYYRGLAFSRMGRKDRLVSDLDRFLQMAPNAPEAGQARNVLATV